MLPFASDAISGILTVLDHGGLCPSPGLALFSLLQFQRSFQAFFTDNFDFKSGFSQLEKAFPVFSEHFFIDAEAQTRCVEGLQHRVFVREDRIDDALTLLRYPRRRLIGILQRQSIFTVGQR